MIVLLAAGMSVLASATGIAEYVADQSETPVAENQSPAQEVSDTDEADDKPESFVPTIIYPDTLFLPSDPQILGAIEIEQFLGAIEADRRLLSELRKSIPDTREDAQIYLNRLKSLAERADPVRLVIVANRVLEQAPIYYDWLEAQFETPQDELYEYYIGGAQGFSRALLEFQNTVLMTVINRLDTASRIVQESYAIEE